MKKYSFLPVLLLSALIAAPLSAFELGVTPIRRTITLRPGETKRSKLQVNNSSTGVPLKVNFEVMDFSQGEDGSAIPVKAGSTAWSAAAWVKPLRNTITLGPKQKAFLGFDVTVPPGAKGGGYACIVCESTVPTRRQNNGTVVFTKVQIPFLLYITISGTEELKAQITKVKKVGSKVGSPFKVYYTVENQGNVLIRPKGTLTISLPGDVRKYEANPHSFAVLPGLSRIFIIEDAKGVARQGTCHVKLNLNYGSKTALEATGDFDFHE
jgi:hypothetical protein